MTGNTADPSQIVTNKPVVKKLPPLIILASFGTSGDILPFIALARWLQDRGNRLLLVAPVCYEQLLSDSGVPYQAFGRRAEWQALLDNPDLWDEQNGLKVIWNALLPYLHVVRFAVQHVMPSDSCVVLCHPFLAPLAALARIDRPELRIVSAFLSPSIICSNYDLFAIGSLRIPFWVPVKLRQWFWEMVQTRYVDPLLLPGLNAKRRKLGLVTQRRFLEHMLKTPDVSVGLFPPWFAAVKQDWPQPFLEGDFVCIAEDRTGTPLSPELERFLNAGDLPVLFTPGSGNKHAAPFFAAAVQALQQLGCRGLFVTPFVEQLPDLLPENVMWLSSAPFSGLLPRTAAIVHHGGIGTVAEAFRSGIPQLIVPFAYEQFDNAFRVKRLGGGDVLLSRRLNANRMKKQLARLLNSSGVKRTCGDIARQMAENADSCRLPEMIEKVLLEK